MTGRLPSETSERIISLLPGSGIFSHLGLQIQHSRRCLSSHGILCVFGCSHGIFLLLQGQQSHWMRIRGPHLNLLTSAKTLHLNEVTFTRLRGEDFNIFLGDIIQPVKGAKTIMHKAFKDTCFYFSCLNS